MAEKDDLVVVHFLKMCAPYNTGERAGFSREKADALVSSGIAMLVREKTKQFVPKRDKQVVSSMKKSVK